MDKWKGGVNMNELNEQGEMEKGGKSEWEGKGKGKGREGK